MISVGKSKFCSTLYKLLDNIPLDNGEKQTYQTWSNKLGINRPTLANLVIGRRKPGQEILKQIADNTGALLQKNPETILSQLNDALKDDIETPQDPLSKCFAYKHGKAYLKLGCLDVHPFVSTKESEGQRVAEGFAIDFFQLLLSTGWPEINSRLQIKISPEETDLTKLGEHLVSNKYTFAVPVLATMDRIKECSFINFPGIVLPVCVIYEKGKFKNFDEVLGKIKSGNITTLALPGEIGWSTAVSLAYGNETTIKEIDALTEENYIDEYIKHRKSMDACIIVDHWTGVKICNHAQVRGINLAIFPNEREIIDVASYNVHLPRFSLGLAFSRKDIALRKYLQDAFNMMFFSHRYEIIKMYTDLIENSTPVVHYLDLEKMKEEVGEGFVKAFTVSLKKSHPELLKKICI